MRPVFSCKEKLHRLLTCCTHLQLSQFITIMTVLLGVPRRVDSVSCPEIPLPPNGDSVFLHFHWHDDAFRVAGAVWDCGKFLSFSALFPFIFHLLLIIFCPKLPHWWPYLVPEQTDVYVWGLSTNERPPLPSDVCVFGCVYRALSMDLMAAELLFVTHKGLKTSSQFFTSLRQNMTLRLLSPCSNRRAFVIPILKFHAAVFF